MFSVGITGGIGTGKSFVAGIFKKLGVPIYDADRSARKIVSDNQDVKIRIIQCFGSDAYVNNIYNRDYIASVVFKNKKKLDELNSIIHPAVSNDFEQWKKTQVKPYCMKEAALLFETGSYQKLDRILVIHAPIKLRIERVLQRDLFRNEAEIKAIIEKQWPQEEKMKIADDIIHNDGSDLIIPQVLKLHSFYLSLCKPD